MVRAQSATIESYNIAELKRRLADLIGRVAYAGATILITRRGKPMAKLVPVHAEATSSGLAEVKGWLASDAPLLADVDRTIASRIERKPRPLPARGRAKHRGA
jgi:prevent-host-death family protein